MDLAEGWCCRVLSRKSFEMRSYKKRVCKYFGMRTYKFIELKVAQNEQLQKT